MLFSCIGSKNPLKFRADGCRVCLCEIRERRTEAIIVVPPITASTEGAKHFRNGVGDPEIGERPCGRLANDEKIVSEQLDQPAAVLVRGFAMYRL